MLRTLLKSLRDGVVTTRYPDAPADPPERFRGAPEAPVGRAELPVASVCPTGAIGPCGSVRQGLLDLGRCVFCGLCAEDQERGLRMGRELELAARHREDLLVTIGPELAESVPSADAVRAVIQRTLGRSLHLRHLDAGSCNACDWELVALLAPHYDVRRLGIDFVASPRHADGVIVTGPVTRNLELAVRRTWDAVPEPRIAIAVGACACSGGIAADYASAGGVDQILPVDVYIPGCPPRPEAIIFGILVALGRREARRRPEPGSSG